MNDLFVAILFGILALVAFALTPTKLKNVVGLITLLFVDYLRQVAYYYDYVSISQINYISTAVYGAFVLYCVFFRRGTVTKLIKQPYLLLLLFWIIYLASAIFSIALFGVEPKATILIAAKVMAFLCAAVSLQSPREIIACVVATVCLGAVDMLTGWTEGAQNLVVLDTRDLGVIPWLRIDAIWLSQALLWTLIASQSVAKDRQQFSTRPFRLLRNAVIAAFLAMVFLYGVVTVQLRVLAIEGLIGFLVVFVVSNSSSKRRLIGYSIILSLLGIVFWNSMNSDLRLNAVQGLTERDDGGRFELWNHSLDIWSDSPIVGHGFGTDGVLVAQLDLPGRQTSHNVYLVLMIETGLIGLIIWLYINFKALRFEYLALRDRHWENQRNEVLVIFILHIAMLFHVAFHGLIYFPWIIMLPAIALSLFGQPITQQATDKSLIPNTIAR